ncbi:unnamed protein product [Rhizophagus irregularis]|nr:unnamed protein product [Rhizophagus irregularis]
MLNDQPNIIENFDIRITAGGRKEFDALPALTQYMLIPEERLQNGIHAGIACNCCGESEWKGARFKCSECPDYDLCFDCIKYPTFFIMCNIIF